MSVLLLMPLLLPLLLPLLELPIVAAAAGTRSHAWSNWYVAALKERAGKGQGNLASASGACCVRVAHIRTKRRVFGIITTQSYTQRVNASTITVILQSGTGPRCSRKEIVKSCLWNVVWSGAAILIPSRTAVHFIFKLDTQSS